MDNPILDYKPEVHSIIENFYSPLPNESKARRLLFSLPDVIHQVSMIMPEVAHDDTMFYEVLKEQRFNIVSVPYIEFLDLEGFEHRVVEGSLEHDAILKIEGIKQTPFRQTILCYEMYGN